jgi:hypothetical protein
MKRSNHSASLGDSITSSTQTRFLVQTMQAIVAVTTEEEKTSWTGRKTAICTVSFTTKISRGGGCRPFPPGDCVRLILHPRSLDAKLDCRAQARGNKIGFRVIP